MAAKKDITAEYVRERLDYDPETGVFRWKRRSDLVPLATGWNAKHSGKRADPKTAIGYRYVCIDYAQYPAHRVAWLHFHGVWPPEQIDHIDGVKDNNRIANLRMATNAQNARNGTKRKSNSSGYKGVSWHQPTRKWRAQIVINGQNKYLGLFDDRGAAAAAYAEAAHRLHGEFAKT